MKKVLVCGATGFIGRNIVEALARRDDLEVHGVRFSRPGFDCPGVVWHQADLRDPQEVARLVQGMDVIVQAAATTSGAADIVARPYIHVTDNAVMNSHILRAAYDARVGQLVFFSCTVMLASAEQPQTEADWDASKEMHPRYFGIGWTKVYVEKMCEFFSRLGVTRHTVIRHSNVYGPHDKFDLARSHVVGATVTKVMSATDGRIVVWGDGSERRDLLYVGDLVDLVERCIDRQEAAYELLNAGSGEMIAVRDLVAAVIAASGRDLRIVYDPAAPTIPFFIRLCSGRARDRFGWSPATGLDEGLRRTLAWWRDAYGGASAS
ncbi:MAG TPA: NAD-dependent epimerase/dehydratase family protein [Azospirillaceae bacterium]|nr:NAD-dependent epimerase/dehydratase family protein [Azospirillaceae bacterium]